jgi:hypothetical protein
MANSIRRRHENDWIAIVDEEVNGDVLTAYALRPDGLRIEPPMNRFQGGDDDYSERKARAQARADYAITMATRHGNCDCPPWQKGDA